MGCLPVVVLALLPAAAARLGGPCVNESARLAPKDCEAWLRIYDAIVAPMPKNASAAPGMPRDIEIGSMARLDPCATPKYVDCSADGARIVGFDVGGRGLAGPLPAALGDLDDLRYLMVAYNNFSGPLPAINYSKIRGCGYGTRDDCCFLSSTVMNAYDQSDDPRTNAFDCPLPPGAAEHCHAVCVDRATGERHGAGVDVAVRGDGRARGAGSPAKPVEGRACQPCAAASKAAYPQCDVGKSLLWHGDHISGAYCTNDSLVVWSDAVPNHDVFLEEVPKPAGSGPPSGDLSARRPRPGEKRRPRRRTPQVRLWNTQSMAYRIPLDPTYSANATDYLGAGALAMTLDALSMYPIMFPDIPRVDKANETTDGRDRAKNMMLDGQMDSCNEHSGRGFDIHYHGDPVCMYDDTTSGHSKLIGWAADGFGLYGRYDKYDADRREPDDLDRCMGHFGATPESNHS